eukprot:39758_1
MNDDSNNENIEVSDHNPTTSTADNQVIDILPVNDINDDEWQINFVYEPMPHFIPNTDNTGRPTNNDTLQITDTIPPETWLHDLYELGDVTRKQHTILECAISDLKSQLNVPPILGDAVSRDVLDEIEEIDPYFNTLPEKQIYFNLEALKLIENNQTFTVFGFVRNHEINNSYCIIPQLIYWLTLHYFHWIRSKDFIFPCECGRDIKYYNQSKEIDLNLDRIASQTENNNFDQIDWDGQIPDDWLLDLYGLADTVRKNHSKFECAVMHLKMQLNVPANLAEITARDVLQEIESVDPYLDIQNEKNIPFNQDELILLLSDSEKKIISGYIRIYAARKLSQLICDLMLYYYHYMKLDECVCVK